MPVETDPLATARAHHAAARWVQACEGYAAADVADVDELLDIDDLERWAESAQVVGRLREAAEVLARCFERRAQAGQVHEATRAAYWLWSAHAFGRREFGIAAGWVERARALAEESGVDACGWLLVPQAYRHIAAGDNASAEELLQRAGELGRTFGDVDLVTIATTMRGRASLKQGLLQDGLALLDAAMVSILTEATSPRASSIMYCAAIGSCYEVQEVERAAEWSQALDRWLSSLPQLGGAYFGNCRIYRAMLMRLRGEWSRAEAELDEACRDLAVEGQLVAGHAWYELAELRRLRGDPAAEDAFERATAFGHPAQPGLALLRLGQGNTVAASAGLRRALAEREHVDERLALLPTAVEICLATDRVADAHDHVAELESTARTYPTTATLASLEASSGALALAEDRTAEALARLRSAADRWRELGAPYETARVSVRLGQGYRALGDEEGALMELRGALGTFEQLGARVDAALARSLLANANDDLDVLSPREVEVLRLIVAGATNAEIAAELSLSERTVHRHVSNILHKLDVRSRTSAATYAVQHGLG